MVRSVFLSTLAFLVTVGACDRGSRRQDVVRPVSGRKPVTAGLLVQMEGAGDYLLATELNRAEYLDHLDPLTHALASFYGWPDPGRDIASQTRFLDELCRARFGKTCGSWRESADALQRVLFSDAAGICPVLVDRVPVGAEMPEDLCSKLNRLADQMRKAVDAMARRWPPHSLYAATACDQDAVSAVVVEVGPDRLWVNGLDVVPLTSGRPPADPDLPAALQSMLAAGAAVVQARDLLSQERASEPQGSGGGAGARAGAGSSSGRGGAPNVGKESPRVQESDPGLMLVLVRRGVPWSTLSWLLRLAASVNLTRVSFRVRDRQDRPCRLAMRVSTLPLPPRGVEIRLGGDGTTEFCVGGRCLPIETSRLPRRLGCVRGRCQRPWFLSVRTDDFAQVVHFLALVSHGDREPLLWIPGSLSRPVGARKTDCPHGRPCRSRPGSSPLFQPGSKRGLVPRR